MRIKVVTRKWHEDRNERIDFFLVQNNWNDFGFYTSYELFVGAKNTEDKTAKLIGGFNILKKGQVSGKQNLIPLGVIHSLSEDFSTGLAPSQKAPINQRI